MTMKKLVRQKGNNRQEWASLVKEDKDLTRTVEPGNELVNEIRVYSSGRFTPEEGAAGPH
jgi:hypothetical protein